MKELTWKEKIEFWRPRFNEWRKNYDNLNYKEQQEFYVQILKDFPNQVQHSKEEVACFLNKLPLDYLYIIEIGGGGGELAQSMLQQFPTIMQWDNYELTTQTQEHTDFRDSRYHPIILDDFVWNSVLPDRYNIFIACHFIEHIKAKDFKKLLQNLPLSIEYLFFEAPIALDSLNRNWQDYIGTHILEWGWKQINTFIKNEGFELFYLSFNVRGYCKTKNL